MIIYLRQYILNHMRIFWLELLYTCDWYMCVCVCVWNEKIQFLNLAIKSDNYCYDEVYLKSCLTFVLLDTWCHLISEFCLYLNKHFSLFGSYRCSHFKSGCHNTSFPSYELFKRKSLKAAFKLRAFFFFFTNVPFFFLCLYLCSSVIKNTLLLVFVVKGGISSLFF